MEKTDWLNRLSQQHAESLTFQGSLIPLTSLGGEITTSLSHIYPASCFFLCLSVGVRLTQLLAESARFVSGARCSITICCLETYPVSAGLPELV